jgi:hypothetical protein
MEIQRIRRFFSEDYYQQVGENERGEWYNSNRQLHSECDRPAVVDRNYKAWYKNGELHRDGSMPAVIHGNRMEWWKNGILGYNRMDDGTYDDNEDKPSIIDGNRQEYYKNGILHRNRNFGPAISDRDNNIYKYYEEGQEVVVGEIICDTPQNRSTYNSPHFIEEFNRKGHIVRSC